ncbi:hypothetical protein [Plebeiibacterium marinum]|uniref:Uncharacterized protein n=1 Tax=Plebeiibacterium marinum TaxID=2992111 RepID=A0AAE3MA40_9BACT|nr:hypothetical protein [Plebeiobacterium marinum]MCW3804026.1 hypothetical protein [Plebeiobacterium marinum]
MKTRLIFSAIALFAIVSLSNAQTNTEPTEKKNTTQQFIDKDNDGVCDHYESRQENGQGMAYRRGNGNNNTGTNGQYCRHRNRNGNNNYCKKGYGYGKNSMKHNKDMNRPKLGQGQFVDANNNGVCDNRE